MDYLTQVLRTPQPPTGSHRTPDRSFLAPLSPQTTLKLVTCLNPSSPSVHRKVSLSHHRLSPPFPLSESHRNFMQVFKELLVRCFSISGTGDRNFDPPGDTDGVTYFTPPSLQHTEVPTLSFPVHRRRSVRTLYTRPSEPGGIVLGRQGWS